MWTQIFSVLFCLYLKHSVFSCEHCWNLGDLHSTLHHKTSCRNTWSTEAVAALLVCRFHHASSVHIVLVYLSLILVQPLFGVVLCGKEGDEVEGSQSSLPSWWHKDQHWLGRRVAAYCCTGKFRTSTYKLHKPVKPFSVAAAHMGTFKGYEWWSSQVCPSLRASLPCLWYLAPSPLTATDDIVL